MERVKVLGILGGIGSGKSTVSGMFADLGAIVLDADRIAHECLAHPQVKQQIRERFGDSAFSGGGDVDRAKLGALVFSRPEDLEALNSIVHPCVRSTLESRLAAARRDSTAKLVVLDVPLLLESPLNAWCDSRVFVDAPEDERRRRVRQTRGWDPAELDRRERAQSSLAAKRGAADYVIDNGGSQERVRAEVARVHAAITGEPSTAGGSG